MVLFWKIPFTVNHISDISHEFSLDNAFQLWVFFKFFVGKNLECWPWTKPSWSLTQFILEYCSSFFQWSSIFPSQQVTGMLQNHESFPVLCYLQVFLFVRTWVMHDYWIIWSTIFMWVYFVFLFFLQNSSQLYL